MNTKLHIEQIGRPWDKYHGFTITGNVVSMQLTAEENTHCGIFNATFSADIPNANNSTGYVTRKWDFRYLYMIVATSDESLVRYGGIYRRDSEVRVMVFRHTT